MTWDDAFRDYLLTLDAKKPVVMCGDLNVAHREIDLKNPKSNRKNAGFTDEERAQFTKLLESGFTDTFRFFNPDAEGAYSWWSYRFKAREKNAGVAHLITSLPPSVWTTASSQRAYTATFSAATTAPSN